MLRILSKALKVRETPKIFLVYRSNLSKVTQVTKILIYLRTKAVANFHNTILNLYTFPIITITAITSYTRQMYFEVTTVNKFIVIKSTTVLRYLNF